MFPYRQESCTWSCSKLYNGDNQRFMTMKGYNVQPWAGRFWYAGRNAAIKNQLPPATWTAENIDHMRRQLKRLGFGYDWDCELPPAPRLLSLGAMAVQADG